MKFTPKSKHKKKKKHQQNNYKKQNNTNIPVQKVSIPKINQNQEKIKQNCPCNKKGWCIFADKKKNRTSNRRDWIKTYIPITISFIALLKSFDTEIIWLWKQLMQLLK